MLGSRWPVPPSARPRAGVVFSAHSLILSTSSWVSRSVVRSYGLVVRGLSRAEQKMAEDRKPGLVGRNHLSVHQGIDDVELIGASRSSALSGHDNLAFLHHRNEGESSWQRYFRFRAREHGGRVAVTPGSWAATPAAIGSFRINAPNR